MCKLYFLTNFDCIQICWCMSIFVPSFEFHEFMEWSRHYGPGWEGYDSLVFERSGHPLSELEAEDIDRCVTISQPDMAYFVLDIYGNMERAGEETGVDIPLKWFRISGVDMSDGQFDALHVVITE